ncbi:MAG: hypothetical protein Q9180_008105 [Flavoplaca navasiana]
MSAVKILHDMTNATPTTTAPSDTTMALTPAIDGHDNSPQSEVDANVHVAASILVRLSNASIPPISVIPGTDSEWEPSPEASEKRVYARISDGSIKPIIASKTSAIFPFMVALRRISESGSGSESGSEGEEEVDDDATIDNEEAVKEREEELAVWNKSSFPSSSSSSSSSSSPSPPPTATPIIIITPPTSTTPPPATTSLALSATSKRKAKPTPIDTSNARPSTFRAPNKRKGPVTLPAITRKIRVEEHGHDIHTPSPNKRTKIAAPLPTPTSISPYGPTAPVRSEDVAVGGKGGKRGLGLDGGYWDLPAVGDRGGEDGGGG